MSGGTSRRVAVLGAGVAGLVSALLLARDGHEVLVIDRDGPPPDGDADAVFQAWTRPGIGQWRQPHNFLGAGRALLADRLPDVYADLLDAGAWEFDQAMFLPAGERSEEDQLLKMLACRRPVFDAVLHRAAAQEAGITMALGRAARGLMTAGTHVTGVRTDEDEYAADLVVDALGRGSFVPGEVVRLGLSRLTEDAADCGLLYYSRHYRFRDDFSPAPASMMGGPRGAFDYLGYAVFLGDNRTMSAVLMVAPSNAPFRALRSEAAYAAVCARIPVLGEWLAPEHSEPLTAVLPMGHLRNVVRSWHSPVGRGVPGLQSVGDALCHTNPTFAIGATQAIEHAVALRDSLAETDDLPALAEAFTARTEPVARARYAMVSAEDGERARWWRKEISAPFDRATAPALHTRLTVYAAAQRDAGLFRAVARRVNLLDPPERLVTDTLLLDRAAEVLSESPVTPPPAPPEEEVVRLLEPAAG